MGFWSSYPRSGAVVRSVENRTVRIVHKGNESTYRNMMTIDLSSHGRAALDLPDEVRERLGLGKE